MNKKLLAVAVAAATFGSQAFAFEAFSNEDTTVTIGGHVSVNVNGSEQGDTDVGSNSPRVNFNVDHDLGNGFTADVKGEWAVNYTDGGADTFTTRLGYIGLTHEDFGRAVVGTQWAPYYDVAGVADMPIAFANDFIYDNHGALGTGRADDMVSYRNGFDFGNAGALSFGLGWQGTESELDALGNKTGDATKDRVQVAVGYDIAGVKLGYAFNTGDIKEGNTAESHVMSIAYGSYGKGLYAAGVYASNEFMNNASNKAAPAVGFLLAESDAYEAILAYGLENSLNLSINYEMVEGKAFKNSATRTAREEMALQAEYNFTPKFVGYTGYQFDLNDDKDFVGAKRDTDNKWTIGARYYL